MNRVFNPSIYVYEQDNDLKTWMYFFGISFLCHVIIFVVLIANPMRPSHSTLIPAVINVDLVSIPSQHVPVKSTHHTTVTKKAATKKPVKKVSTDISKKKVKQSPKKKNSRHFSENWNKERK